LLQRIRRYIEESWSELKKVTWPTPRQTWNLTVLVFVVSAMVGVFIFGVDAVFTTGLKIVTSL
jgi:preprotein translocase subunit SecE